MHPRRLRKVFQTWLRLSPLCSDVLGREKPEEEEKSVYGSSEGLSGFCLNRGLECFAKAACGWSTEACFSGTVPAHCCYPEGTTVLPPPARHSQWFLSHAFCIKEKKEINKVVQEKNCFLLGIWFVFTQTGISTHGLLSAGGRCCPSMRSGVAQNLKTHLNTHFCNKIAQLN